MEAKEKAEKIELEKLEKKLATGAVNKETYNRILELSFRKKMRFSLNKELQFLRKMRKSEKERVT